MLKRRSVKIACDALKYLLNAEKDRYSLSKKLEIEYIEIFNIFRMEDALKDLEKYEFLTRHEVKKEEKK